LKNSEKSTFLTVFFRNSLTKLNRQPCRFKIKENFMSDKKRITFFHLIFCSRATNIRFITCAPTPPPAFMIKRCL
jgi:hypothetical protein